MLCEMHQPVERDGSDASGPNIDQCPNKATHTNRSGKVKMCSVHAKYYRKYIGGTYLLTSR